MKFESIKRAWDGAVSGQVDVTLTIDKAEARQLKDALALVRKYDQAAFKAMESEFKQEPETSDWCMVSYCIKNDKVIVSVKDGMAG